MNPGARSNRLLSALLGVSMLFICGSLIPGHADDVAQPTITDAEAQYIASGWQVRVIRQMPETVTALLSARESDGLGEEIYIGMGGTGRIHRLYRGRGFFLTTTKAIAVALGDDQSFGKCHVNRLAICDLDHDGINELVAETSQIVPRGKPRIYVWSLTTLPVLRGFARPDIASSWGHGLGFLSRPGEASDRIISTYCGFGEIVEYQLAGTTSPDGFQQESVGWRVIGNLPASGEGIQLADADNDGVIDLCLGTGYALRQAAIHICDLDGDSVSDHPRMVIDEGQRFGTVKFLVGSLSNDGSQDLFVWWCTGLGEGHTEVFQYRLTPQGIASRVQIASGTSDDIWPIDGQITLGDVDGDGYPELWFATSVGNLWSYAPSHTPPLTLVCQVNNGLGPITVGGITGSPCLYAGSDSRLLQISPHAASAPSAITLETDD